MSWRDRGPAYRATVQLAQFIAMIAGGVVVSMLIALFLDWGANHYPHALAWLCAIVGLIGLLFVFWHLAYEEEVAKDRWKERSCD